jgi:hypothetical protein
MFKFKNLFSFFTQEIAIDLGTANTLIIHNDQVVVDEPSIVAVDRNSNQVIAVGKKAMMMHEKTHQKIKTIPDITDINSKSIPCYLESCFENEDKLKTHQRVGILSEEQDHFFGGR